MTMNEIKAIARERGIKPGNLKKGELIRKLQAEEGNDPCFDNEDRLPCEQDCCLWFDDCQRQ